MDGRKPFRYIPYPMRPGIKQKFTLTARLAVSAGLIWFVLRRIDLADFPDFYPGAGYRWLLGAFFLLLVLQTVGSWRWGILLAAQGIRLTAVSVFMYYIIGFFFNNLLPTTVGGDVVKVIYLKRNIGRGAAALVSVVLDRVMGIAGLVVVAAVSLALGWGRLTANPDTGRFALPLLLMTSGLVAGIALFFSLGFSRAPAEFLFRLIRWPGLRSRAENVYRTFSLLREKPTVLLKTFAISVGIWLLIVIVTWMVYRGFHDSSAPRRIAFIPFEYFFLFIPAIGVFSSLPITFAGWGTREASFDFLFSSLPAVESTEAVFMALNFYLVFLATAALGGIVYVFKDQLGFHREESGRGPSAAGSRPVNRDYS